MQTDLADSTLSDSIQGIDAGRGLFASRDFDPDSPVEDSDLVGFYTGTELTKVMLSNILSDPNYSKMTGYILSFQGIIIDGWDHTNNSYAGVASAINDFLDDRNNCHPCKELVPNANKSRSSSYRIAFRVNRFVPQHSEFGFAYGEHAFCKADLPLPVLFKAARYYHKEIMKNGINRWSQLPQARYLFNSPYHGAAPATSNELVHKIIGHIKSCGENMCYCGINEYVRMHQTNPIEVTDTASKIKQRSSGAREVYSVDTSIRNTMYITTRSTNDSYGKRDPQLNNNDSVESITDYDNDNREVHQKTINYSSSHVPVLCFHDGTASWQELDSKCAYDDSYHHFNKGTIRHRTCFLTTELQDLRAHRLVTTTIGNYFNVLCQHFCHDTIQYVDPLYTSIMVGLDSSSLIDINPLMKDRHVLCELLLCAIVHAGHISHVTVDYVTHSLFHDDSHAGYHDSTFILDGMERFLMHHFTWRRERGLRVRDDCTDKIAWRKVYSSRSNCTQQQDGDSCGIYACWNATARVHFKHHHVPQMRLHIYHCCVNNILFLPCINILSDSAQEQLKLTASWYIRHREEYRSLQSRRFTNTTSISSQRKDKRSKRSSIHVASSTGQNNKQTVIDIKSSSPSATSTKHQYPHVDIPSISEIVPLMNPTVLHADDHISTLKEEYTSPQLAVQPDASKVSPTAQILTDVHRINISHKRRSEITDLSDTEDINDEGLTNPRTLSTVQALQIATTVEVSHKSNRKRTLSSPGQSYPQEAIIHNSARKRAHWIKGKLGQARQKLTMDSFINIVKTPLRGPPREQGGRAAARVDKQY